MKLFFVEVHFNKKPIDLKCFESSWSKGSPGWLDSSGCRAGPPFHGAEKVTLHPSAQMFWVIKNQFPLNYLSTGPGLSEAAGECLPCALTSLCDASLRRKEYVTVIDWGIDRNRGSPALPSLYWVRI